MSSSILLIMNSSEPITERATSVVFSQIPSQYPTATASDGVMLRTFAVSVMDSAI